MDTALTAPRSSSSTHVGLEQRVLARLKQLRLPTTHPVMVGFSGGPDSLALAAILARLRPVSGLPILLVHVDHGLRTNSADDATQCRCLAEALDLSIITIRLEDGLTRRYPGVGVEEAARRERYVALARQSANEGSEVVAVAHHLEDQAETVLLHLLRGSGLGGATGMADLSSLTVPWWSAAFEVALRTIRLWRPFLDEPRDVIRSYATATGLTPLNDPTNDELFFRRNRLRHQVLPVLRSIEPGADAALARYARIAREEDLLLDDLARQALGAAKRGDGALDVRVLAEEHLAIRRRVVRLWLDSFGAPAGVPLDRIDAVLTAAAEKRGERRIEIGKGWFCSTDGRRLLVLSPKTLTHPFEETILDIKKGQ